MDGGSRSAVVHHALSGGPRGRAIEYFGEDRYAPVVYRPPGGCGLRVDLPAESKRQRSRPQIMVGPGETEYAVGIAVMARQVRRRDRRAVRPVLAQFESREAVDRGESEGRRGDETEKEALQNKGVNDHNASQPAPKTPLYIARLWSRNAHPAEPNG